jgi:uncharacterized protein (TIGR02246 family)
MSADQILEDDLSKQRVPAFLLFTIMLITSLAQAQGSRAHSEVAIRQLEQDLAQAATRNDWRFWDSMVAPECTIIDPMGRQLDKPAVLADMKNFKGSVQSIKFYDVQVRFFRDDVAMATGIGDVVGSNAGKTIRFRLRNTDILVYREGKWLVTASQATLMNKPVVIGH